MKNEVVWKTAYDEQAKKLNVIQTNDISHLVKKSWLWQKNRWNWKKKNTDHDHCKMYVTTKEFNKLMVDNFAAKLVQADLSTKANIDYLVEKT